MGAGASLPAQVDKPTALAWAGERFDEAEFDARTRQPKPQAHKPWWNDAEKAPFRQRGWNSWSSKRSERSERQHGPSEGEQPAKRGRR